MKLKRLFAVAFVLCLMLAVMAFPVSAAAYSGTCGMGVKYEYDPNTAALRIYGSGKMLDYYSSDYSPAVKPWINWEVETLKIESGVTYVGDYAFYGMRSITKVTLADSVEEIGDGAFELCTGLKNVTMPAKLKKLGQSAFFRTSISSVVLAEGLTKISDYAFSQCDKLRTVECLGNIQYIGDSAFYSCDLLTSVYFKGGTEGNSGEIGDNAFYSCGFLENVTIPEGIGKIGESAFGQCRSITELEIPDSVYCVMDDAFAHCAGLRVLHFPEKAEYICSAFTGCTNLKIISFPAAALREMGGSAFSGCTQLLYVHLTGDAPAVEKSEVKNIFGDVSDDAVFYYDKGTTGWQETFGKWETAVWDATAKPQVTAANKEKTGKPVLTWKLVEDAVSYQVYRSTAKDGTYTRLGTTTELTYTNGSAETGVKYYYKIKAVLADGSSVFGNIVSRTADLAQPVITLSNRASDGKIKISWNAVEGAVKYYIYRSLDNENWSYLASTTDTSAVNSKTDAGVAYYYKVRAIAENSAANSAYSSVKYRTCDLARPTVTLSNVASTGKIKISWNAVEGAVKYYIYRSLDNENWSYLASTTDTSAVNSKTDAGVAYYYKVKAIHATSAANSAFSAVKYRTCDLAQPTLSVTLNSAGKPRLSWSAVDGAVKYQIVRSTDNKNWEHLAYTTNTYATNSKAVAGTKYYYKVRAIASVSAANSAYSPVKYVTSK